MRNLFDKAEIRAGVGNAGGPVGGKALQVDLIYDEPFERDVRTDVTPPVKRVVHHNSFRYDVCVVTGVQRKVHAGKIRIIGKEQVVPVPELGCNGLRIRIKEEFVFIEPQPLPGDKIAWNLAVGGVLGALVPLLAG